jgi:hypothetical protein
MTFGTGRSSASRTGRLYPQECSWYSFSLGAESTPGSWNGRKEYVTESPVTPPGIFFFFLVRFCSFDCSFVLSFVFFCSYVLSTHNRQPAMIQAGLEPAFPVSERPQAHALGRAAIRIFLSSVTYPSCLFVFN